jgi:hypothetical protein
MRHFDTTYHTQRRIYYTAVLHKNNDIAQSKISHHRPAESCGSRHHVDHTVPHARLLNIFGLSF